MATVKTKLDLQAAKIKRAELEQEFHMATVCGASAAEINKLEIALDMLEDLIIDLQDQYNEA